MLKRDAKYIRYEQLGAPTAANLQRAYRGLRGKYTLGDLHAT